MAVDPERWHQLSDVFHKALERPADRRMSFLDDVCRDDPALRDEVVSLLSYHEQSGGLPDTPWQPLSSHSPDESEGSLVGQRLNQYTVIEILGAGGMGVVYLADDTRLGRRVALKALSRRFTDDHERREARAAAGLSHPGIATIYALEEIGHDLYLVSEYVQGATLRDEVNTGPLASGSLLATGLKIARALAAAHEAWRRAPRPKTRECHSNTRWERQSTGLWSCQRRRTLFGDTADRTGDAPGHARVYLSRTAARAGG